MHLSHKIRLKPTVEQAEYFKKACGTARFTWNWALAEWENDYKAGQKPNAMAIKKRFNATKYQEFPWIREIHRDAHARPFADLAKAWVKFFSDKKANLPAYRPRFKKKGRSRDSFYLANDKFSVNGKVARLPKIGDVAMSEALRFQGNILGATVSRTADRWFIAVQVDVPDGMAMRKRTGDAAVGVDLGVSTLCTLSHGEKIPAPKPLKKALRRLKIRSRAVSRKLEAAKQAVSIKKNGRIPKGTRLPVSNNQRRASLRLSRMHMRIADLRSDALHKLTSRLCRENQAVGLEDLNVKGIVMNEHLARAISDVGFGEFRRQMAYKAHLYGTTLVFADRWYPSSKLCSACGFKNETLKLSDRSWVCSCCGATHDRDINAAINLKRLANETALPVASRTATYGTALGIFPGVVGKVTPVSYDAIQASGQEGNRVHLCASN